MVYGNAIAPLKIYDKGITFNLILRRAIYRGFLLPRRSPDPTPDRHGQNGPADIGVDVIRSSSNTESGAVPETLHSEPWRKKSGFGGKTTRTPEPPIVNFAIDMT